MKICVLSEYFYPDSTGGTGTVLSGLIRQLKESQPCLEIDVITSKNLFRGEAGKLPARENWQGIDIFRLSTPQPRKKSVKRRLAANLLFTHAVLRTLITKRKKYDLVLVVTAPPTLPMAAWMYSKLTGTPYVYLVYDLFLDMALALNMVKKDSRLVGKMYGAQRQWLQTSTKIVALGRCMRDFLIERYKLTPDQVEVIPIPANLEMVTPSKGPTKFRTENSLDGFVVLYAGNFAQYQDFDTLLNAAAHLKHRSDITFAFVGDGAKKEYIQSRVENEKLTNVKMFPFVPQEDLSDLLSSADVSLVTLEKEMAGLAVPSKFYNILASGRATVAVVNPTSEVGRVVTETNCGVQIMPEDALRLSEVIAELANDPARVAKLGHNARALCEQRYSLEQISNEFFSVFCNVTERTRQTNRRFVKQPVKTSSNSGNDSISRSPITQQTQPLYSLLEEREEAADFQK